MTNKQIKLLKNKLFLNSEKLFSIIIFSIYFTALCFLLSACSISKQTAWDGTKTKTYNVENGLYTK